VVIQIIGKIQYSRLVIVNITNVFFSCLCTYYSCVNWCHSAGSCTKHRECQCTYLWSCSVCCFYCCLLTVLWTVFNPFTAVSRIALPPTAKLSEQRQYHLFYQQLLGKLSCLFMLYSVCYIYYVIKLVHWLSMDVLYLCLFCYAFLEQLNLVLHGNFLELLCVHFSG